jgi:hypothetical protein
VIRGVLVNLNDCIHVTDSLTKTSTQDLQARSSS